MATFFCCRNEEQRFQYCWLYCAIKKRKSISKHFGEDVLEFIYFQGLLPYLVKDQKTDLYKEFGNQVKVPAKLLTI